MVVVGAAAPSGADQLRPVPVSLADQCGALAAPGFGVAGDVVRRAGGPVVGAFGAVVPADRGSHSRPSLAGEAHRLRWRWCPGRRYRGVPGSVDPARLGSAAGGRRAGAGDPGVTHCGPGWFADRDRPDADADARPGSGGRRGSGGLADRARPGSGGRSGSGGRWGLGGGRWADAGDLWAAISGRDVRGLGGRLVAARRRHRNRAELVGGRCRRRGL